MKQTRGLMLLKATTMHGTYYIIDTENKKAKRIKAENRQKMHGDNTWFSYSILTAYDRESNSVLESDIEVGKSMYFMLTGPRDYDWRISTNIMSLEKITEE